MPRSTPVAKPSSQSRAVLTVMHAVARPVAEVVPLHPFGVRALRGLASATLGTLPLAPGTTIEPVDDRGEGGRVRGEWVLPPTAARRRDRAILYIHGSGYVACSPRTHRAHVSRLAALTRLPVFSLAYRRGPEFRFPVAGDDALRAMRWLAAQGIAPGMTVVAGDSAGGHLALDVALEGAARGHGSPAGLYLISPLVDPTFSIAGTRDAIRRDPLVSAGVARRLVGLYAGAAAADEGRAFPLTRDLADLPPTLVQVGGREMLRADGEALADAAPQVELEVWRGQVHVFPLMAGVLPEAGRALQRAAAFIREMVPPAACVPEPTIAA